MSDLLIKGNNDNDFIAYVVCNNFLRISEKYNLDIGSLGIDPDSSEISREVNGQNHNKVEQILKEGGDVNDNSYDEKYILWIASENRDLEMVKLLVQNGARYLDTSLVYAIKGGSVDVFNYLIYAGADKDSYNYHGQTILITATINYSVDIINEILKGDVDIYKEDYEGLTVFDYSADKPGILKTFNDYVKRRLDIVYEINE